MHFPQCRGAVCESALGEGAGVSHRLRDTETQTEIQRETETETGKKHECINSDGRLQLSTRSHTRAHINDASLDEEQWRGDGPMGQDGAGSGDQQSDPRGDSQEAHDAAQRRLGSREPRGTVPLKRPARWNQA